ncbi:cysteine-rich CWC family protein [Alicyclobacillus acidiphilus]|uniref:cysteine-rich CWC family protein n=1 Tax=Alicyclobacillus acidiphilus TaxID=182455 RepID=UPI000A4E986B|nr:cysteine-rich CWC family protein [Alicyclobacillus acidiphilus]
MSAIRYNQVIMSEVGGSMAAETLCPLCGMENQCGRAAGCPPGSCWCDQSVFPAALLEQIPLEARNKACICKHCLERFVAAQASEPN